MSQTLVDVPQGGRARISGMRPGGAAIRQRLLDMGVTKGANLVVERVAPLGDPLEIYIKGYHLALRKTEAALIEVETE